MDKKGEYRSKKRTFHGNRFSSMKDTTLESTSAKKFKLSKNDITPNLKESPRLSHSAVNNRPTGYRLIDLDMLSQGINNLACKLCGGNIYLSETNVRGLGSKILINCKKCNPSSDSYFYTSKIVEGTKSTYEVNRRFVYAMRSIGQGLRGAMKLCGIMNMQPPITSSTYNIINNHILEATKIASKESMQQAVLEEVKETNTDPNSDITVSGDGTWMKRGHTSLHGVSTIIGANTGKIIDIAVLSSFCHGCNSWTGPKTEGYEKWIDQHYKSGNCRRNHFGSAGSMEVEGIKKMFQRSEELYGVRYTNYIGDGDTSTFPAITKSKPYGSDVIITKEECVGHVQKRLSSRLRKLKTKNKGVILSDGKHVGGKNRLTDAVIDQLAVYYGNAIRGNSNDLAGMRKAIWAIWNHKASSNETPLHHFCPKGLESWCKYQKAIANNTVDSFSHSNSIPMPIMKLIKPIFTDLSMPELLRRCLKGKTQNVNESYNSVLWSLCPKRGFAGSKIVEIAAHEATLVYNEGCLSKTKVLNHLGIVPGKHTEDALKKFDLRRLWDAEKRVKLESLEGRRAKRRLRLENEQLIVDKEGVTYAAGEF